MVGGESWSLDEFFSFFFSSLCELQLNYRASATDTFVSFYRATPNPPKSSQKISASEFCLLASDEKKKKQKLLRFANKISEKKREPNSFGMSYRKNKHVFDIQINSREKWVQRAPPYRDIMVDHFT